MRDLVLDKYGPVTKELMARARQELRPQKLTWGAEVQDVRATLQGLSDTTISPNKNVRMPQDAQCLHAALWLLFDFFKESHAIAQQVATPSGSYWHAIQHRRESDPANARYWFSRVGDHPIFPELMLDAKELAGPAPHVGVVELVASDRWDPDVFVKLCTTASDSVATQVLLSIQRREWELLFEQNYRKAFAR